MLDHLASNDYRLHWGPGRHGPGHNLFTYHRDPDGNVIELFTQLDSMIDEAKGYWEPRPWHEDSRMSRRPGRSTSLLPTRGGRSCRRSSTTDQSRTTAPHRPTAPHDDVEDTQ